MDDLTAARSQMALSLGFHIIFSCIGMAMPFFMALSHYLWLTRKKDVYLHITRAWSKGVGIFFATGAVSGTVLSFEMGLLWPNFMKHAGPIFGLPFSLEGAAFFIEAIALGFYLYGWNKLNRWFHWFTGLMVGICGVTSGILVVSANSWMNSPSGFTYRNGQYLNIDPVKAMFNDAWFTEAVHMTIAAFAATAFAVAGVHAWLILKKKAVLFNTAAFKIAICFGVIASLLQPLSGDRSAKGAAKRQPVKLAAMEAHFKTGSEVPLLIGGVPDMKNQTVHGAIEIPGGLSFLVNGDFKSAVKGLDQFPQKDQPPVAVVHYAFQLMVGLGLLMAFLGLLFLIAQYFKKNWLDSRWFFWLFALATPAGFLAVEAGWTVTEVGRQPWIIQGVLRTTDAVTIMPGIIYSFYLYTAVYVTLAVTVIFLLYRQMKMVPVLYDISIVNL
ncbi:cytochrome d ubiquinol oxidase subunit I [Mucilaginibacter sp. SG538B]|uniref:cytochrome ubiquinol oxidase subunit I n=1 Tax=Mucilaginibacter sp. SG538B TaxID=2587021 RepID=UPI00159DAB97|nr:cytochrome ubiquinol oxidase subunit I [Mucilaginibacter sp. SG538B]NVM66739.1 cytochrome d ubiquinol oxidase subunit I [Mucilaginibacter sp. SG538B]